MKDVLSFSSFVYAAGTAPVVRRVSNGHGKSDRFQKAIAGSVALIGVQETFPSTFSFDRVRA